eukprot:937694-Prymnesium_polylepis.1
MASRTSAARVALPKSMRRAAPAPSNMTLGGLISLCTTPFACRYATASTSCEKMRRACTSSRRPVGPYLTLLSRSESEPPGAYSISTST